jgi:hypothetical protein
MPELRRSSTSQSTSSIAGLRTQTVSDRYLHPEKLKAYLNKRFPGQHKVEVCQKKKKMIGGLGPHPAPPINPSL